MALKIQSMLAILRKNYKNNIWSSEIRAKNYNNDLGKELIGNQLDADGTVFLPPLCHQRNPGF